MKLSFKSGLFCLLVMLVIGVSVVSSATETRIPGLNLKLTDKQMTALQGVFDEYSSEHLELIGKKIVDLSCQQYLCEI